MTSADDTIQAYAKLPAVMAELLVLEGKARAAQAEATMQAFKARAEAAGFTEGSELMRAAAEQLAALPMPEIPAVEIPAPPAIEPPEFNFDYLSKL